MPLFISSVLRIQVCFSKACGLGLISEYIDLLHFLTSVIGLFQAVGKARRKISA